MNIKYSVAVICFGLVLTGIGIGQTAANPLTFLPEAEVKLSVILGSRDRLPDVTPEMRKRSYAKLLEGQRFVWRASRLRSRAGIASMSALARDAFRQAVEINPELAEGYTALADLAITMPPGDIDEGIALAGMAVKLDRNNFGGQRLLARLHTIKSFSASGQIDQTAADLAISHWKEIARLDQRSAEAWAFLSTFYEVLGKGNERIDALRNWLGSAAPVDSEFYRKFLGRDASLEPESASLPLGQALLKAGRSDEAVEILATVVADDPSDKEAVDELVSAISMAKGEAASGAVEMLQRAIYANPGDVQLVSLLAQVYARSGKFDEAVKLLRDSSAKAFQRDRVAAASIQIILGDTFAAERHTAEALTAYEDALKARGLDQAVTFSDDERSFLLTVFEKMIRVNKAANRKKDVIAIIERARKLLGKDDLFADWQLISLYPRNRSASGSS